MEGSSRDLRQSVECRQERNCSKLGSYQYSPHESRVVEFVLDVLKILWVTEFGLKLGVVTGSQSPEVLHLFV